MEVAFKFWSGQRDRRPASLILTDTVEEVSVTARVAHLGGVDGSGKMVVSDGPDRPLLDRR
jgi:hypothetical protein